MLRNQHKAQRCSHLRVGNIVEIIKLLQSYERVKLRVEAHKAAA